MGTRVMHPILALAKRFGRDEAGVFAVLFGLIAIVLIALGGAGVDYVTLQQARNRSQIALDAAALALQPLIFVTPLNTTDIRNKAQALMTDRIGDASINATIDDIQVNVDDGSLFLTADLDVPTIFVSLVGVQEMSARIQSEATRRRLALEVAFVLDNSGSMANFSRMTSLKSAALCATKIIFYGNADASCNLLPGATVVDNVRMAVVPFTGSVNVGSNYSTATWIDTAGVSPIARNNFDNDDEDANVFTGNVNRLALFDQLTNVDWGGCVEARPHTSSGPGANNFYDTSDYTPNPAVPASLFVPLFHPDLAESTAAMSSTSNYGNYITDTPAACNVNTTCTRTATQTGCNSTWSSCNASTGNWSFNGANKGSLTCTCSSPTTTAWVNSGSGSGRQRTRTESCPFTYTPQNLTQRELQERLCKYTGAVSYTNNQRGPNGDCPAQAIRPLTNNPTLVNNAINAMVSAGATNIHEGAAWGFRVLSPTLPFAEGDAYDEATSKIMIVMTDGENTAYHGNYSTSSNPTEARMIALNGTLFYSAYGWPVNSNNTYFGNVPRLGGGATNWTTSQLITEMNARTLQTCSNAKEAGINVYTIGLATDQVTQSTPAVVQAMLRACASSPDKAYFPTASSELTSVFRSIAEQLAALRLAQ